jgi:cobalt-zinc-cadmium efflux system outer membrane protein
MRCAFAFAAGFLLASSPAAARTLRLTLEEAEALLKKRNPDLAMAAALVEAAQAEGVIARQFPNPTFSYMQDHIPVGGRNAYAGSAPTALGSPGNGPTRFLVDNNATAILSWTVEVGKRGPRQRRAEWQGASARADAADLLRRKHGELHAAFLTVLRLREELAVVRHFVRLAEETVRMSLARPRAAILPGDLAKLNLERREDRTHEIEIGLGLERARLEVALLLGLDESVRFEAVGELLAHGVLDRPPLPPTRELIAGALERRPDLRSLRAQIAGAEAEINLAAAARIPDVNLQLGYSYDAPNSYLTYGFSLPLPFVNRFRGEEARARAHRRRLQEAVRASSLRVATEVREALLRYREVRKLIDRYRGGLLDEAATNLDAVQRAYVQGKATPRATEASRPPTEDRLDTRAERRQHSR